jgi:hypothetical protein
VRCLDELCVTHLRRKWEQAQIQIKTSEKEFRFYETFP